jgi:hypothetical protein
MVSASATLDYESNKVDATVCMTVTEQKGNRTTFSGCGVEYVYTSEPDRVIEGVLGDGEAYISYAHGSQAEQVKQGPQDGPVRGWTFSGLGENSGAGGDTQVAVQLNKLRVVSTATGGCVSAMAYSEAKRMNALGAESIRRLDSQLKEVDPEILRLRPRFAPRTAVQK